MMQLECTSENASNGSTNIYKNRDHSTSHVHHAAALTYTCGFAIKEVGRLLHQWTQLLHLVGIATAVCWLHLFLKSSPLHPLATITFALINDTDTSNWTDEAIRYCTYNYIYLYSIGVQGYHSRGKR